ncbi:UDP-glucose-sterol transferase [Penicillium hetheringtonii]|uniref:UDP-glucose-sterol transferase n=1 Tax=Penicillium hetheringtonii TaxID=911720 RepID=A0AAD6D7W2_9EURO|nr:UDP-glucose-sterol transferase [Penicillium hetheringtonii]
MEIARHRQVGKCLNGVHLDLEGFQALAAVADDGRINFDFHHSIGKADETVERLLSRIMRHEKIKDAEDTTVAQCLPILNIVIQVIGSRGDVQPFVVLGTELHKFGHRVRIATHPSFKAFVENAGLEFFSIGGDPKEMMTYMIKHPGLLPHFQKAGDSNTNRTAMREMLDNLWMSCYIPGDNSNLANNTPATHEKPFVANAIIANPPSFAHIHCAEKLGVPLHMMFTMPWSPTRTFAHPLANIQTCSMNSHAANYLSFMLTDTIMWLGLKDMINSFRTETLGLAPIHILSAAATVHKLKIPFTYCCYLSKPPVNYTPPHHLVDFLERFPHSIYIGFGSVILQNAEKITRVLLDAIQKIGVSAVINRGWANLGQGIRENLSNVLFIDDCPHGWIFKRVSCVVHHGGAGTTAAAIAAGKPSVIVPCYGDQRFWAEMATMAGAGPAPIFIKDLSADRLAHAIQNALAPEVLEKAIDLGLRAANDNGAANGMEAFHRQISGHKMQCSIYPRRAADWKVKETDIILSAFAAAVLMDNDILNLESIEFSEYGTLEAIIEVIGIAVYSAIQLLQGLKALGAFSPNTLGNDDASRNTNTHQFSRKRAKKGTQRLLQIAAKKPMRAGVAFTHTLHNYPLNWGDTVRSYETTITNVGDGLKLGGKGSQEL